MKNKSHVCRIINEDTVGRVRDAMPGDDGSFLDLAHFFKSFGDPTRLKILSALSKAPLCVCDIAALIGAQHSAVSHQLAGLARAHLIRQRKEGKLVYYSLADRHVEVLLATGFEHLNE